MKYIKYALFLVALVIVTVTFWYGNHKILEAQSEIEFLKGTLQECKIKNDEVLKSKISELNEVAKNAENSEYEKEIFLRVTDNAYEFMNVMHRSDFQKIQTLFDKNFVFTNVDHGFRVENIQNLSSATLLPSGQVVNTSKLVDYYLTEDKSAFVIVLCFNYKDQNGLKTQGFYYNLFYNLKDNDQNLINAIETDI